MTREPEAWRPHRIGLAVLCAVALLQITLGLAGLAAASVGVDWPRPTAVRDWQRAVEILAFAGLAAHLLLGARRDARIEHLGTLLLLIAVFYAQPPILALANALPGPWDRIVLGARALTVDAFTPALAWLFARDFPRALEWPRVARFVRTMIAISLVAAGTLVAANLIIFLRGDLGALGRLARADPYSHYWTLVFGPLLPLLPFVLWRTRHAPADERRRVGLFTGGVALAGIFPVLVAVLPPFSPALSQLARGTVVASLSLSTAFFVAATTAYSVVAERVLDVRTVLRKAAQYWLAFLVVGALAGTPFVWLAILLYRARGEALGSLFFGPQGFRLLALLGAGIAVLALRRFVMLAVDRVFFRAPYDAERILALLATEARAAASSERLARSVMEQVEAALHPESIGIVALSAQGEDLIPMASALRPLPRSSALVVRAAASGAPIAVDLARPSGELRDLPEIERVWLGDAGAALLVPMLGSDPELDGILVLGPKRSELPYSRQDRLLLQAVGGAAGIGFENRRLRGSASGARAPSETRASECVLCGHVTGTGGRSCGECGGTLREAALPAELFGKFRIERRIGEGGMGVVYSAIDLALGRRVALKTLPSTHPEDADRLRREARAMAAITHPNLALILGAETWQGTPVLVLEYLAGGTLEARLARGALRANEAFDIAERMSRVLVRLHGAGLLHRDVKPSNVGFTDEGEPKLLDFGLARILAEVLPGRAAPVEGPLEESAFGGTPLYMSPEALDGGRPDPGFDLWGLAVLTFEALTGRHPFQRASAGETLRAVRTGWSPHLAEWLPSGCDPSAEMFEVALAADRVRRPGTAVQLHELLRKAADASAASVGTSA